jgi:hypothetical protein
LFREAVAFVFGLSDRVFQVVAKREEIVLERRKVALLLAGERGGH